MKNLFTVVETEEEFLREIAKNYYKLDTPILVKQFSLETDKVHGKEVKHFKKAAF
jgi:hypothetical protein